MVNYSGETVTLPILFGYAADFADIFEVRGTRRERRGTALPPQNTAECVELSYRGLDGVVQRAVRPGRNHHGARNALEQAGDRARRSPLSRSNTGGFARAGAGRRAGQ